jgi:hypothetical protein
MRKVEIIPPASSNWVRLYSGVTILLKKGQESFTHFLKPELSASKWIVDKS